MKVHGSTQYMYLYMLTCLYVYQIYVYSSVCVMQCSMALYMHIHIYIYSENVFLEYVNIDNLTRVHTYTLIFTCICTHICTDQNIHIFAQLYIPNTQKQKNSCSCEHQFVFFFVLHPPIFRSLSTEHVLKYIKIYNIALSILIYTIQVLIYGMCMGWLRLVGSLKLQVSFTEYRLFYKALLQKRPIILRSLLIVATPQDHEGNRIGIAIQKAGQLDKHLESSKQNCYIISLWVIIKAIFIKTREAHPHCCGTTILPHKRNQKQKLPKKKSVHHRGETCAKAPGDATITTLPFIFAKSFECLKRSFCHHILRFLSILDPKFLGPDFDTNDVDS